MVYSIKGFLETSFSDWPGKVAAVLFLPYCNFRCLYCHNYELVLRPEKFPDFPLSEIIKKISLNREWIDGVCLTGGEPTIHRWLPALLRFLKEKLGQDMLIKLDTNGSAPKVLEKLIQENLVDYVAMDLKAPLTIERYEEMVGVSLGEDGLGNIQKSIAILLSQKVDHEFRTTIVPALLQEKEIYEMARTIKGAKRYTLQNFNPRQTLAESLRHFKPLDESTLQRLQKKVTEIIGANNCLNKSQIKQEKICPDKAWVSGAN
ncbi:MAG: anaerobic ribonucleoside-triphosphate reductase activating protein [Methanothermobacter tenebrarum]